MPSPWPRKSRIIMNTLRRLRPQFGSWWKPFNARRQGKPARRSARLELLPLEARNLLSFTIATPGVFNPINSTWFLRSSNTGGVANAGAFQYGGLGWFPVVGDWNGDGSTTIGAVNLSTMTWFLRDANSSGPATYVFQFGVPGWIPVVGDWDGQGHTGIGAFDPTTATWYLRDFPSSGSPTSPPFVYGAPGWTPVTGEWIGHSRTNIGVVSPGLVWYLRDTNTSGAPTTPIFQYGGLGWTPVERRCRLIALIALNLPVEINHATSLPEPPSRCQTSTAAANASCMASSAESKSFSNRTRKQTRDASLTVRSSICSRIDMEAPRFVSIVSKPT